MTDVRNVHRFGCALAYWPDARTAWFSSSKGLSFDVARVKEETEPFSSSFDINDWTTIKQAHGSVVVTENDLLNGKDSGDAFLIETPGRIACIQTADCVPVVIGSDHRAIAIHAGWKGLESGVIKSSVKRLKQLGETNLSAGIGPHVKANCYEFRDASVVQRLKNQFGHEAASITDKNTLAIDLSYITQVACSEVGVEIKYIDGRCTYCAENLFSYRAGDTLMRNLMAVTIADEPAV